MGKDRDSRLRWRNTMFIPHPKVSQAVKAMLDRIERTAVNGASSGIFIYGETGSGKTRLAEYLRDIVKEISEPCTEHADHVPVVLVKCPEVSTRKQLALQILAAMGAATPRKHTYADLMHQIATLAGPVGLRVIIIDDLQDLLRGRTRKGVEDTAVALRDLFDRLGVTLVLLGTPESLPVIHDNLQLRKRLPYRHALPYFDVTNTAESLQFKKLIHELERWLPLAESSDLTSSEMLVRLLKASNGIFQYLLDLLDQAVVEACKEGQESLTVKHLERAFDWVYGNSFSSANPFSVEKNALRSLNKVGEPFHGWT